MKKYFIGGAILLATVALTFSFWIPLTTTIAEVDLPFFEDEPDIPAMLRRAKNSTTKEEFTQRRAEYFGNFEVFIKTNPPILPFDKML